MFVYASSRVYSVFLTRRYGLFASISAILRADMQTYLQEIVQHMMESLQSTEGVLVRECGQAAHVASYRGPFIPSVICVAIVQFACNT